MSTQGSFFPQHNNFICPWITLPDPFQTGRLNIASDTTRAVVSEIVASHYSARPYIDVMQRLIAYGMPAEAKPLLWSSSQEKINDVFFHSSHAECEAPGDLFAMAVASAFLSLEAELAAGSTVSEELGNAARWALIKAMELMLLPGSFSSKRPENFRKPVRRDGGPAVAVVDGRIVEVDGIKPAVVVHPSMRRWVRMHGSFFVVTQALINVQTRLQSAVSHNDLDEAESLLMAAAMLFRGTRAIFEISTDFDPQEFKNIVRPTMEKQTYPGFSGTRQLDHAVLLNIMKKGKSLIGSTRYLRSEAYGAYITALSEAYDAHAMVCERFVGDGPSLSQKRDSGIGAADMIRSRLKTRALSLAGTEPITNTESITKKEKDLA